jgi:hypothetical protein
LPDAACAAPAAERSSSKFPPADFCLQIFVCEFRSRHSRSRIRADRMRIKTLRPAQGRPQLTILLVRDARQKR